MLWVLLGTGCMPRCGRGCPCAHAQALALELTRTELKCMAKYRYWLHVAVEGQTILCVLCRLMKAIMGCRLCQNSNTRRLCKRCQYLLNIVDI